MFCSECNNELPTNAKFCMVCGTKVKVNDICIECGEKIIPGAKFCLHCGHKVESTSVANKNNSDIENYNLYGYTLVIPNNDIKLHKIINNLSDHAYQIILKEYESAGNLGRIVEQFPTIVKNGYVSCAEKLLTVIAQTTKKYDMTAKDILNLSEAYNGISQINEFLQEHFLDLQGQKDEAKMHRENRKNSRSRLVGGGTSISSAAKGMAIAGTFNLLSGGAHSLFNLFDGALTNDKISTQMHNVFKTAKDNLYYAITIDMTNIVLGVANKVLGMDISDYSLTPENEKKASTIFDAIEAGRVPNNEIKEQIVRAIEFNVCYADSYIRAYNILGDEEKSLLILAEKLSVDKAVNDIKQLEIAKKKEPFIKKFASMGNATRSELLEFKAALENAGLYNSGDELSEKVNDAINNTEINTVRTMMKNYNSSSSETFRDHIVNKLGFGETSLIMYHEWLMLNIFEHDVNQHDKKSYIKF